MPQHCCCACALQPVVLMGGRKLSSQHCMAQCSPPYMMQCNTAVDMPLPNLRAVQEKGTESKGVESRGDEGECGQGEFV